ncbi:MAG TPA: hypothetical protein PK247_08760, partial [Candidatus Goldiibacteriota bacterium]|nr:hypothetical protein [Candidatus Goldiibacteriota bacterium]
WTYTATHTHTGTASATNTFVNTASYTPTYTNTATPTNTVFTPSSATPTPDTQSGLEINDLFIYPCPVNAGEGEDIRIRFNASRAYAGLTFKFYTVSSRLIRSVETGFGNSGVNTVTIPNSVIKGFAAGTYYFVINSENNKKAAKIDKIIVMKK